jgi:hypothetical protein
MASTSAPLTQKRLIACILINLLATPGLGSIMARRPIAGTGQLVLALAGCGLLGAWVFNFFYRIATQSFNEATVTNVPPWMWSWGLILFGASWIWSLVTCLSLWSELKKQTALSESNIPPRIS